MSELESSPVKSKLPLRGVVIFVSQQLGRCRLDLHQQCTALGGKFVWVFDVPFTHYICQGKLSKRAKEYRKAEEYRAECVHPAWLKACYKFRQRVAEKLYATTYNPNRSLSFIAADDDDYNDEDEENHIPSSTITIKSPTIPKSTHIVRSMPDMNKNKSPHIVKPMQIIDQSSSSNLTNSISQQSPQISNEAETMLSDLESSLAQFLHKSVTNISTSRLLNNDDEQNRQTLKLIRSISNINNSDNSKDNVEPSMRIEWLDDAMKAERKKMNDEDEHSISSQSQQQELNTDFIGGQKRPLTESNCDQISSKRKCRN